jgi:DNA-binding MarR family transcriptional regulator
MGDALDDLEGRAWKGLMTVHGRLLQRMERDLLEHTGLTNPEFEVLVNLSRVAGGSMRLRDLSAASLLTKSGMSRLVDRLEAAGWLRREEAPEDRRGALASLTPAGAARFKAARRRHLDFVRRNFLDRFDRQELAQLARFWERVEQGWG